LNWYSYVNNNPIRFGDPLGLEMVDLFNFAVAYGGRWRNDAKGNITVNINGKTKTYGPGSYVFDPKTSWQLVSSSELYRTFFGTSSSSYVNSQEKDIVKRSQELNDYTPKGSSAYKNDVAAAGSSQKLHTPIYLGGYSLPIDTKYTTVGITQGFWGMYSHKGSGSTGAVDLGTQGVSGIELNSILAGTVVAKNQYCNNLKIESVINFEEYTIEYLHMAGGSTNHLNVGDYVEMGSQIGIVGGYGSRDGDYATHLDFRVINSSGVYLDPLLFFNLDNYYSSRSY